MKCRTVLAIVLLHGWAAVAVPAFADQSEPNAAATGLRGDPTAAREAWSRIESGALVIDVRSPEEFAAGHLEGALRIDYLDTETLANAIGSDQGRSVVLYCGSGRRAGVAQSALEDQGYTAVFNASGLDALEATRP
jgi:phage shock protein E